jgi:hypothetical protein
MNTRVGKVRIRPLTWGLLAVAVLLSGIAVAQFNRRIPRVPVPPAPPGLPGSPLTDGELFYETLGAGVSMSDLLVARSLKSIKRRFPDDAEYSSPKDYYSTSKEMARYRLNGAYGTVEYTATQAKIDYGGSLEIQAELVVSDISPGQRGADGGGALLPGTKRGVKLRDNVSRLTEQYGEAQGLLWGSDMHMLRYYAPGGSIAFYMNVDTDNIMAIVVYASIASGQ